MNNIISHTPSMTANILDPKRKDDARDSIAQLELLNALYLHDALITKISPVNSDEFIVDVYDQGFTLEDGSPADPTRQGIIAHAMHSQDWFAIEHCQVGQRVLVHLLSDNSAWIKHPEEPQLGVVVCDDCDSSDYTQTPVEDGEMHQVDSEEQGVTGGAPGGVEPSLAGLPPNYYRVAFARIWNQDGTLPHRYAAFPQNHPLYNVVAGENLLERNCKSHYVRPGTVVVLKWNYDNQTPPQRRYFFECADEGTCGMSVCSTNPSSSSSSSSSCGAICVYTWTVSWDCVSKSFSAPTWISNCDTPVTMIEESSSGSTTASSGDVGGGGGGGGGGLPPLDVWIYDGTRGGKCWFHYNQITEQCCDEGVPCDQPPPYPGDPPNPDRCCSLSSSSGSCNTGLCCWYFWQMNYDCDTQSFGDPIVTPFCDDCTDPQVTYIDPGGNIKDMPQGQWVTGQDQDGACGFFYLQKTLQCCTGDGDCNTPPDFPGNPPNPEQCCASSQSSGSQSSGSQSSGSQSSGSQSSGSQSGSTGSTGSTGTTTPCNAIVDIQFSCDGKNNLANITYCDGTTSTRTWPCCCDNPSSMGSSSSRSYSSSSRSGSAPYPDDGYCYYKYIAIYDCNTGQLGPVTFDNFSCGDMFGAPDIDRWYLDYRDGNYCQLYTVLMGDKCADSVTGDCGDDVDMPPVAPNPPSLARAQSLCGCHPMSSSSSGSDDGSTGTPGSGSNDTKYCQLWYCPHSGPNATDFLNRTPNYYVPISALVFMPFYGFDPSDGICYTVPDFDEVSLPPGGVVKNLQPRDDCDCSSFSGVNVQYYKLWHCPSTMGGHATESEDCIKVSEVPSLPYFGYSETDGLCYTVPAGSSKLDECPGEGTVRFLVQQSDCNCAKSHSDGSIGSSGPSDDQIWMQLRDCATDALVDKWINVTHQIITAGRIRDTATGKCYEGGPNNPQTSSDPGNVIPTWNFTAEDCDTCNLYWRIVPCGSGTIGDFYVTKRVKEYMQDNAITAFRIAGGGSTCYEILPGSETDDLRGGTLASVIRSYADCAECDRNPL